MNMWGIDTKQINTTIIKWEIGIKYTPIIDQESMVVKMNLERMMQFTEPLATRVSPVSARWSLH